MREILFRGQSINSHKWVEGYLVMYEQEPHIFTEDEIRKGIDIGGSLDCCEMFPVFPNTVEQYIGMTDVFGTKIFEGDIVKYYCYGIDHPDKYELKLVEWVDECCGFEPFSDSRENCGHCGGGIDPKWCEVIGNVHNSLEFLNNAVMRVDNEDLNQLRSILETYAKKTKEKQDAES